MTAQVITTFFDLLSSTQEKKIRINEQTLNENSIVVIFTFNVSYLRSISSLLLLVEEEIRKNQKYYIADLWWDDSVITYFIIMRSLKVYAIWECMHGL